MSLHKHRVFISYHHNDQKYKDELVEKYNGVNGCFIDYSVDKGEIDESLPHETIRTKIRDGYLIDATVTIVLLGANTHKRKHVAWEIASSIINGKRNHRNGLLGVLLPSHPAYWNSWNMSKENTPESFLNNYEIGYAKLIRWENLSYEGLSNAIEQVFKNKKIKEPDHSALWKK